MALQTSGIIRFSNLTTEFGGTAPHSISEYYKTFGLVPNTVAEAVTASSLQGSVYDGRGNYWGTPPTINGGNYIYQHYRWADNGYTGTGDISWIVNKTGTYNYQGSYYVQLAPGTSTNTWYVNGSQVDSYTLTAVSRGGGNYSTSRTGSFSVNSGQRVRVVVSWQSYGWASSGIYFGGSSNNSRSIQTSVNGNVPTSGTLSLTNFYGARNT